MGAAEDERAVRQRAGGGVVELVASDAVVFREDGDVAHRAVVAAESVLGADPDVALLVLLDGADVRAGSAFDRAGAADGVVVAEQAVADGAEPDVPGAVQEEAGGVHDGVSDVVLPFLVGGLDEAGLAGIGEHLTDQVVEGSDQHAARGHLHQGGGVGPFVARQLEALRAAGVLVVADQLLGIRRNPDAVQVVLGHGDGVDRVDAVHHLQLLAVVAAAEHAVFLGHDEPEFALPVAEEAGAADIADAVVRYQTVHVDLLQGLDVQVIDEQAVVEGGDPEVVVPVRADGHDGFMQELVGEVAVPVETAFVHIGNAVTLVRGAEPQVAPAVAENGADLESGNVVGESRIGLVQQAAVAEVVAEHAVGDGMKQHVRAVGEEDVDIAADEAFLLPDGRRNLLPGFRTRIEDAELAHAGEPDLAGGGHGGVVDRMPGLPDAGGGEAGGIVAAQFRQGGGPDAAVLADQGGQAAEVPHGGKDAVGRLVVAEELAGAVEEHAAVARLHDFGDVPGVAFHGDAPEAAFFRAQGDAVGRSDPELAGGVAVQGRHLVVWQAQRVVRAEILMILLDAVFIESAESADPDMAVGILREGVHPLVGKPVGDSHDLGAGNGVLGVLRAGAGQRQQGNE